MKNGVIILGEVWARRLYGPEAFSHLGRGSFPELLDGKRDYQLSLMSTLLYLNPAKSARGLSPRISFINGNNKTCNLADCWENPPCPQFYVLLDYLHAESVSEKLVGFIAATHFCPKDGSERVKLAPTPTRPARRVRFGAALLCHPCLLTKSGRFPCAQACKSLKPKAV